MPDVPILNPRKEWNCPNCDKQDVTVEARPHSRFHNCPGLGGLSAPFVEKSRNPRKGSTRVRKAVREDYVGSERGCTLDEDGAPVMSIVTEYADGSNDVAVFAPTATADGRKQ